MHVVVPVAVVYVLRGAASHEVRYVGQTTKGADVRFAQHRKAARLGDKKPVYDWMRKIGGEHVVCEIVDHAYSLDDVDKAERWWIAEFRRAGHRLLNLTDGGIGGIGYVWTEEQRRAQSERLRGRTGHPQPKGEDAWGWGKRHSEEQKAKWSAERKGMNAGPQNPNFGKFGPEHPSYGRATSPETRALLSEQKKGERNPNFGKTASAETRRKMSEVRRGRPMPSSRRSAHTRYHTNRGVTSPSCVWCTEAGAPRETTT